MYFFSDYILYPLIYHIARYRVKVVRANLANSFPDKSTEELRQIERDFYHQFCDIWIETIWGYFASREEIEKHITYRNVDMLIDDTQKNGGCFAMFAHLGCWELIADFAYRVRSKNIMAYGIYKALHSKTMDRIMYKIREKRSYLVEKNQLLRHIVAHRKNETLLYGMLSDQGPTPGNQHMWMNFLNQETSFLDGSEVLGKKFGFPCYYVEIHRIKRGYYEGTFIPLTGQGHEGEDFPITREYADRLEKNIQDEPSLWLWTHKRWKYKRPQTTTPE